MYTYKVIISKRSKAVNAPVRRSFFYKYRATIPQKIRPRFLLTAHAGRGTIFNVKGGFPMFIIACIIFIPWVLYELSKTV